MAGEAGWELPTTEATMSVKSLPSGSEGLGWCGSGCVGRGVELPVLPRSGLQNPQLAAPKPLQLPQSPPWQAVPGPAGLSSHHLLLTPHGALAPAPDLCRLPSPYSLPFPTPSLRRGPSSPPEVTWGQSGAQKGLAAHLWY